MNELALFAGAGGGILGGKLLNWTTVCAVENDPYAISVLLARQNDGILPPFPIWDDIRTFDGKQWRGRIDLVSGGFPCQDISVAGKGAGISGKRSGLWGEMARIIRESRPSHVYVENSPALTSRGLGRVLGDLAALGFDAEWGVLGASDCGAPHKRERIWIVAHAMRQRGRLQQVAGGRCENTTIVDNDGKVQSLANPDSKRFEKQRGDIPASEKIQQTLKRCGEWPVEPGVGRVVDGMAFRVDRLKALGNGQVPRVAATAWEILKSTGAESEGGVI